MPASVESTQDNDPPTVRFTNVQDLLDVINCTTGDFLTVTNVTLSSFTEIELNSRILIITIPTDLHEALHLGLLSRAHPGGDGGEGEGDSTGGLKPECIGLGKCPTLVISAGDSETLGELHNGTRWWFQTSNHEVKIVILAKFDRRQHHILLEKWEEELAVSYNVTRGALVLGFRLLFLHDPGPQEGDFLLSIQDLQMFAEDVWAVVPGLDLTN
ncbi:hypothetical protein B0H67DRAFT_636892 [Lasiosphaeris hirsuta]|uniref:Uncharacterized protein n=1 Tax=Lasiosphaeris hirsuta TaxID=260670 RepID=A0AA40A332_9PEZI|nr:hypothetical protein B0H67DRAFT_636892 [Lasiosphaeris hirsuta]